MLLTLNAALRCPSCSQFFKNPALFPPEKVAACNPENGALPGRRAPCARCCACRLLLRWLPACLALPAAPVSPHTTGSHPFGLLFLPSGALFVQVAHQRQQELSQARYELALAREQLAALSGGGARQEAAAEQQGAAGAPPQLQQPGGGPRPTTCKDEEEDAGAQLSPAQLRALHGAVLAHLQAQGFRVAALSLSKEAQLPPPRGADSQAPSAAASLAGMYAAAQQLAAQSARLRDLEVQAEQQGRELAAARQLLEESRGREAAAAAEVDFLRGRLAAMEQAQQAQQAQQVQQQRDEEQQRQQAPPAGQQPPPGQAPPAPSGEGAERGATLAFGSLGATGALEEVAACMPRVLPNVLINKREGKQGSGRQGASGRAWNRAGSAEVLQQEGLLPHFGAPPGCHASPGRALSSCLVGAHGTPRPATPCRAGPRAVRAVPGAPAGGRPAPAGGPALWPHQAAQRGSGGPAAAFLAVYSPSI